MLYAAIVHCPVFRGTPKAIDESSIAGMKGVRSIVRMPDAVAVVAEFWWRAKRASDALRITWDDRGNRSAVERGDRGTGARRDRNASRPRSAQARRRGRGAWPARSQRIEADYEVPFLAHATMEPQTCTAHVKPDGVEVWAPSQDAATLVTAAVAAGVPQ